MVVKDGTGTPLSLTLALDEGDLAWTNNHATREIMDRGALSHTRPGNEQVGDLSFSVKWVELLGKASHSSVDAYTLYEMVENVGGAFVSTSGAGQQFTLKYEFTVTDPADSTSGTGDELIVFAKAYPTSLECAEGDEYGTVKFTGRNFETKPTITRPNPPS
jgi:hypothetical protein